jgi:hypothetical protein
VLFHGCEEGERWNNGLETGHGNIPRSPIMIVMLTIFSRSPEFRRDLENIHVIPRSVFCSRRLLRCLFRTDLAMLLRAHPCRCIRA